MTTADYIDFDLDQIILAHGSHGSVFRGEACLVEAACQATISDAELGKRFGKPSHFSDDHPSISRVIRAFVIVLNDSWQDQDRHAQPALDRARSAAAAARAAAGAAAGDAAREAAGDAAGAAAGDAAGDAAGAKLAPVVATLQTSALVLLDEMIAVGRE